MFKLIIVTYRGQETFLIPVMECQNSITYIQRRMDRLLHDWQSFVKAYINNVIIRSKTFTKHVAHLHKVFTLFTSYNISIKPIKTFLGYTEIDLLGQQVNFIGFSIAEAKLEAIAKLKFPSIVSQLETFLGMIGYLQKSIPRYVAVAKPLQDLKTNFLKNASVKRQKRKNYLSRTKFNNATTKQMQPFMDLKKALSKSSVLIHFTQAGYST